MSTLLAPHGRYATAVDIEKWIDAQAPLLEIIDATINALGLGEPRLQVGPRFYPAEDGKSPHLRRGAVWFIGSPATNVGFRVELYGPRMRIQARGLRGTVTYDTAFGPKLDVKAAVVKLSTDLWSALQMAELVPEQLPLVEDGLGSAWAPCGPGCDLHVVRPGHAQCSCEGARR